MDLPPELWSRIVRIAASDRTTYIDFKDKPWNFNIKLTRLLYDYESLVAEPAIARVNRAIRAETFSIHRSSLWVHYACGSRFTADCLKKWVASVKKSGAAWMPCVTVVFLDFRWEHHPYSSKPFWEYLLREYAEAFVEVPACEEDGEGARRFTIVWK